MNSAGRILKLISYFEDNQITLRTVFSEKYSVDTNSIYENLNFMININKEIEQLDKDLVKINKRNSQKYEKDLNKLYSMFLIRPLETGSQSIINATELGKLIVRLEGLEDLLESSGIYENIIEDENISKIIEDIDKLIKKIDNLEDEYSSIVIKILNEIKFTINTHKMNGVKSIEEALEKLFCKSSFLSSFVNEEVKNDINKLIGHIYGTYTIATKYVKKPIEYAKKQYDKNKSTDEIIDVDVENSGDSLCI